MKPCDNPDCLESCTSCPTSTDRHAGRHLFAPAVTWQRCCSTVCRNHLNYLLRTKPKRDEQKDVE